MNARLLSGMILCIIALPGDRSGAQERKPARIKIESRLVLVDLLAHDGAGNPIPDLGREEIEVLEDGKRMEILFFETRRADRTMSGEGPSTSVSPSGQNGRDRDNLLVFLIDRASIPPLDLPRVKEAIQAYLHSNKRPNEALMLATGAGSPGQPPTRDLDRFLNALEAVRPAEDTSSQLLQFGEELERLLAVASSGSMRIQDVTRQAIDLGRQYILREEKRAQASAQNSIGLIREISSLPGRKNALFFSGGYLSRIGLSIQEILLRGLPDVRLPGLDSTHLWIRTLLGAASSAEKLDSMLRSVIEEANRSQVSFYTVDARGLTTREDLRFRKASYSERLMRDDLSQSQEFLRDVAAGTGGRWFLNSNDLQAGVRGAHLDSTKYYELGYAPAQASRSGTLHRITVRARRPGVTLLHRQSYAEPAEYDPERLVVENALKFAELFRDFPFEADFSITGESLRVDIYVPVQSLSFGRRENRRHCELAVHVALFDGQGELYQGKTLFSKTWQLDFSDAQFAGLAKVNNVTASFRSTVKPGSYRMRVVARQKSASKTAALEKRVTIPG